MDVFKLQLAIYLHGDLKEEADIFKCIVYRQAYNKNNHDLIPLRLSLCLPQLTPSANPNFKLAKEIVLHTFAERSSTSNRTLEANQISSDSETS